MEIQKSQNKYQDLFNTTDDSLCVIKLLYDQNKHPVDWLYMEANPSYMSLFGFKDAVGQKISELKPYLEHAWFDRFHQISISGKPARFVQEMKEDMRWFEVYVFPDSDTEAHILMMRVEDVTLRKKMEDELRQRKLLMDSYFNNSPVGFIIYDEHNNYEFINEYAAKGYGVTPRQITGKNVFDVLPDKLSRRIIEMNQRVLETGKPLAVNALSAKLPLNSAAAKDTYWQGVRFPVPLENGTVGVGAVNVEVTQLVHTLGKLKYSEEKFQKVFASNPVAILLFSYKDETVQEVNETWELLTGYEKKEVIGQSVRKNTLWPDSQNRRDFIRELEANGKVSGWETNFMHKSGRTFVVDLSAQFLKINNTDMVLITFTDITERKKLMKIKEDFLGVASHELKTPITTIKAYNQVLQLWLTQQKDNKALEISSKMDKQINRLTELVTNLLDTTKIDSGKFQFNSDYFNLNEVITETVDDIQQTSLHHQLIKKLDKPVIVYGNKDRIGQVMINMLTNAIKYSPHATKVVVSTELGNDEVMVRIQDFGVGIAKNQTKKIFERFYRIDGKNEATYPGLGLGLYISSEIIKRQGGKIGVTSRRNGGSTFYFSLPIARKHSNE